MIKEWNETICSSSSIFIQWSVDVCIYIYIHWRIHCILIQALQNSWSCLHFGSQQSLTHAPSLHWVRSLMSLRIAARWAGLHHAQWLDLNHCWCIGGRLIKKTCHFGICLSFIFIYIYMGIEGECMLMWAIQSPCAFTATVFFKSLITTGFSQTYRFDFSGCIISRLHIIAEYYSDKCTKYTSVACVHHPPERNAPLKDT